ncbi:MAG: zinc ABC transporter substrate-binding protein [Proteobacteria bacterium]|nr:zinc ABC transporter substrate-binding protein [Pseudomonadota bacterium]
MADNKIKIVTSVAPLDAFAKTIGGEMVEAHSIVPPSYSHESFEPKLKDLNKIADCELLIIIGHNSLLFEKKIVEFNKEYSKNNTSNILDLSSLFTDSNEDPHFWSSPIRVLEIAKAIKNQLLKLSPKNNELFENNFKQFSLEISNLDQKIKNELSNKSQKTFISYHPSWYYLAKDYQLTQIAIENQGKEPSLAFLSKLITEAKQKNIHSLVYEPYAPKNSIKLLTEQAKLNSIEIDPSATDWQNNMQNLINFLSKNL